MTSLPSALGFELAEAPLELLYLPEPFTPCENCMLAVACSFIHQRKFNNPV